ncbi:hypothetical protein FACHB389_24160 [Nostoc calcicola FACHB-389]|nr:hypothetical protein FACHB389_24160 [Nostoc calcicola FACHB-389]
MGFAADIKFTSLSKQLSPPLTNLARESYFYKVIFEGLGMRHRALGIGIEVLKLINDCPFADFEVVRGIKKLSRKNTINEGGGYNPHSKILTSSRFQPPTYHLYKSILKSQPASLT